MGEDLEGPGCRVHDVMRATEFVIPALEIIDYRTAWCTDRLVGAERLGKVEGRLPS